MTASSRNTSKQRNLTMKRTKIASRDATKETTPIVTKKAKNSKVSKTRSAKPSRRQQIQAFDDDAFRWVMDPSIPGAHCPIFYIGEKIASELAQLFERSLTRTEAQYLVQPDGPIVKCNSENIDFQPIRYVPHV